MSKKIKIVLIANTATFFKSFMLSHVKQLSKKYELIIICNDIDKLKKFVPNSVLLKNIKFKRGLNFFNDLISFFVTLFFFLVIRPDLSISFTPKIGFIVSIVSFFVRAQHRIHWYTGQIWVTKKGLPRILYKSIDKFIFSLSHKVLIDSLAQRKFLIREKVVSVDKSVVLHKGSVGGVDIKKFKFDIQKKVKFRRKFSISKNSFVFLYLGRINKEKGIIELIKAFNKIKDNHDVFLIFVGPIEDKIFLNFFIENKKILYFDFTNKPQDWFSLADVLCVPSHREGFGTVVIEAAACGVPTLGSNIFGLKDAIIEHKTGFFHKVGSISDIKTKMLLIIKNRKLVKKFGGLGKKRVLKDFEQSLVTKKFLNFLNSNLS